MATKRTFSVERFFQALGDTTRLRLLNLMGEQEICVCYFVEILGGPQPKISRHLAYLRSAGIISARREGRWMHYRIVMPPHIGAAMILRQTLEWLKEDKAMQADRARLVKGVLLAGEVCAAGWSAAADNCFRYFLRGMLMATTPMTTGQVCAPAARRKLSFLDRYLTLWIFLAMAVGVAIGHFVPSTAGFVNRFSDRDDESSDCHRVDRDDVSTNWPRCGTRSLARCFATSGCWRYRWRKNWVIGPILMFLLAIVFSCAASRHTCVG